LVQRREAAQLTADMQSNSGVMSFRVVDPPRVPSVPVWPNRFLLMSAVLLAAVGGGVGFAILLSQLHPTIGNERKLREIGGLPVFGTVTMAWTEAQLRGRRVDRYALIVSLLGLLTAYAAVMTVLAARRFPGVESLLRLP
jgi:hypothetical protein